MPVLRTGDLLDDSGNPIYIPVEDRDGKGRPCRVTVTLRGVYYSGDDIGADWRLSITIDGATWLSGPVSLQYDEYHPFGDRIYEQIKANGCGMTHVLPRTFAAEETSWILKDKGRRHDATAILCTEEGARRREIVTVPVAEHPPWFMWPIRRQY